MTPVPIRSIAAACVFLSASTAMAQAPTAQDVLERMLRFGFNAMMCGKAGDLGDMVPATDAMLQKAGMTDDQARQRMMVMSNEPAPDCAAYNAGFDRNRADLVAASKEVP